MKSNVMERTVTDVIGRVLDTADDEVFVIAPDAEMIEGLIDELDETSPSVHLLADSTTLSDVMDNFLVAGSAADHVEAGTLEIRRYDDGTNALVVTDSAVVAIVRADDSAAGLTTDDSEFSERTHSYVSDVWERAEAYDLRTPSLTKVYGTLEAELGSETTADFKAVLSAVDAGNGALSTFDEVTVSLLAAARNQNLLYDISKWGEDVGIASKATFSRTKTRLEEFGLIDTEKVPIDVGRPRLRLKLGDERLKGVETDEFVRIAQSMLEA